MAKNSIYAHAEDKSNYIRDRKITAKQWKIYYYMLSVSKFDAKRTEKHRYIYRKDFNIAQACRDLGIKSNQTFYNAIEKLEKVGLVSKNDINYYLYSREWVEVNKDTLTNLIKASKNNEGHIDLLRTYLILKKLNEIAETSEERSFTTRQLIILLGHSDKTSQYYSEVKMYIALLSFWGLIKVKIHTESDSILGHYTVYHLQSVESTTTNPDFVYNLEAEQNATLPSQELMEKLQFSVPELL